MNDVGKDAYARYVTTKIGHVAGYDEKSYAAFARTYAWYLRGWLPPARSARILDAGCGHGNLLYALRQWGYEHLDGVDLSEEQVQLARERFPDVVQGDALQFLASGNRAYDLIAALDVIEHLPLDKATEFLELCRQAMTPGGRLIMQTPNAAGLRAGVVVCGDITHERVYAPSAMLQLLLLAGFERVEFRETGPVPRGVVSCLRYVLWQALRGGLKMWDYVETGRSVPVYTRNMLVTALRG